MNLFNYDSFISIIGEMKTLNKIYNMKSINKTIKNGFILRHDVDLDVNKAYEMSSIEKNMEVTSTYFFLVTSEVYNISSFTNRNIVKAMALNGFEIGLHFDPTIYGDINQSEMHKKVINETSIIEDITGIKVKSVSLHNPSIHNQYPVFEGYNNAYSKEFFSPDNYLSDSCKDFRGKDVFEFIKKSKDSLLQLVFHPIHFSSIGETYIESFNKIIESKINNFDKYIRLNKTYKSEIGNHTLLERFINYVKENNRNG